MAIVENSRIKLTYEDYLTFPDDGQRHEIVDGDHVVNPSPSSYHQTLVTRICVQLFLQVEKAGLGRVLVSPMDVRLSTVDIVQPDILVVLEPRTEIIEEKCVRGAPDLAVEIVSESTARRDRGLKKARYEKFGVTEYWVVDPDLREPNASEVVQYAIDRDTERFASRGKFREEIRAEILPGLRIDLTAVW